MRAAAEPHGELLSYFFFQRHHAEELIQMGRADARRRLARGGEL